MLGSVLTYTASTTADPATGLGAEVAQEPESYESRIKAGDLPASVDVDFAESPMGRIEWMKERLGGGKVMRIEEPIYGGADGALKIAHDMPQDYWEQLK